MIFFYANSFTADQFSSCSIQNIPVHCLTLNSWRTFPSYDHGFLLNKMEWSYAKTCILRYKKQKCIVQHLPMYKTVIRHTSTVFLALEICRLLSCVTFVSEPVCTFYTAVCLPDLLTHFTIFLLVLLSIMWPVNIQYCWESW